jgi:hypothetical protein
MKRTFLFTLLLGSLFTTQLSANTCPTGSVIYWSIPNGWVDYLNTWKFDFWYAGSPITKVIFDNGYIRCQYSDDLPNQNPRNIIIQSTRTYPQPTISSTSPWKLQEDQTLNCTPAGMTSFDDSTCVF